jgi:hypothetical protein
MCPGMSALIAPQIVRFQALFTFQHILHISPSQKKGPVEDDQAHTNISRGDVKGPPMAHVRVNLVNLANHSPMQNHHKILTSLSSTSSR